MRAILLLGLVLASASADASIPSGRAHGRWHVVSISSLSGTGENDGSIILVQGDDRSEIRVDWDEDGPVKISINIANCAGEKDFYASYRVDLQTWRQLSPRQIHKRLKKDFSTWLTQASLVCPTNIFLSEFDLTNLGGAISDWNDRMKFYAPRK